MVELLIYLAAGLLIAIGWRLKTGEKQRAIDMLIVLFLWPVLTVAGSMEWIKEGKI